MQMFRRVETMFLPALFLGMLFLFLLVKAGKGDMFSVAILGTWTK